MRDVSIEKRPIPIPKFLQASHKMIGKYGLISLFVFLHKGRGAHLPQLLQVYDVKKKELTKLGEAILGTPLRG